MVDVLVVRMAQRVGRRDVPLIDAIELQRRKRRHVARKVHAAARESS